MIRSMYQGISGMKAYQEALSVTGNNISNSQSTSYKAQKASFQDLLYQQMKRASADTAQYAGTNPIGLGNGVKMGAVTSDFSQGSIKSTGGKSDVAIEGDGFFAVGNNAGENIEYTRNGAFNLAANQKLVNEQGQYVLGWNVNNAGDIDEMQDPVPIKIEMDKTMAPEQTTAGRIKGNIDMNTPVNDGVRTQFPVYDDAGNRVNVSVNYVKTSVDSVTGVSTFKYIAIPEEAIVEQPSIKNLVINKKDNANDFVEDEYDITTTLKADGSVDVTVQDKGGAGPVYSTNVGNVGGRVSVPNASGKELLSFDFEQLTGATSPQTSNFTIGGYGEMKFEPTGELISINPSTKVPGSVPNLSFVSSETKSAVNISLNMNEITAYGAKSKLEPTDLDGTAAASISGYNIGDNGVVEAMYDDGTSKTIAQLTVATFKNPQGLMKLGGGNYAETVASGEKKWNKSGDGTAGSIRGQVLEKSNVDLSSEFVDLMVYQKAFQGSTKIIQISDKVIEGVVNLIR